MGSDVLAASGLHGWALVGLVLFVMAFVALCARVLLMTRAEADALARIPLSEPPVTRPDRAEAPSAEVRDERA